MRMRSRARRPTPTFSAEQPTRKARAVTLSGNQMTKFSKCSINSLRKKCNTVDRRHEEEEDRRDLTSYTYIPPDAQSVSARFFSFSYFLQYLGGNKFICWYCFLDIHEHRTSISTIVICKLLLVKITDIGLFL